jgi:ABC-2 type transport system ATP-binding protein
MLAIETENLTKYYGKHRGVLSLFLQIKEGQIFGYLGPNGAGKTTTIRLLMSLIRPTDGNVKVLGLDLNKSGLEVRRHIGYIGGELSLYEDLTGKELLNYLGNLRRNVDWTLVSDLSGVFECDLTRSIRELSRGNKQKIDLIQAFMHRPELLILDEPTIGLDPLMQHAFLELLDKVKKEGRTVFLSSHNLGEVEKICDEIGIIKEGKLVAVESVESLKQKFLKHIEVEFKSAPPLEAFAGIPNVRDVKTKGTIFEFVVSGQLDPMLKRIAEFEVENLTSKDISIEDIFMTYYSGEEKDV